MKLGVVKSEAPEGHQNAPFPSVTRPLRVCIAIPYDLSRQGGVLKHGVHLAETLRTLGDEVDIIGPASEPGALAPGMLAFGGVHEVWNNGSSARIGIFSPPWKVWQLMKRRRYDVLHVHEPVVPALNYWAVAAAGAAARVCTFHTYGEDARVSRAQALMARLAYPQYDVAIAVSEAAARAARRTWRRPISIIPNGVPSGIFVPSEARVRPASEPLRLLFVGNWRSPRKGLPHLLEAFGQLRASGMNATLDVVGEGAGAPEPAAGVTYHGSISPDRALAPYYADCDLFISPATGQESFGIVLLEAMASARAVIASDIEGFRCAIGDNADKGVRLVPPKSPDALAQAIRELATDAARRREMGIVNRRRALEFDWTIVARKIRDQYLAALSLRSGARDAQLVGGG